MMRPPEQVMRLERLGAAHATRLSFARLLLRRARRERWQLACTAWAFDAEGIGQAAYALRTPQRSYALVAQTRPPVPGGGSRGAWDSSFVLCDGPVDAAELARIAAMLRHPQAARGTARDLVLARARRSGRLFGRVVQTLAAGRQPEDAALAAVGYLMRMTAIDSAGRRGTADREQIADRAEYAAPLQAELLALWLIRSFAADLVEHCARALAPAAAVALAPALRRRCGLGHAAGPAEAPFLLRQPLLLHRWMAARETALARVRALPSSDAWPELRRHLERARAALAHWRSADAVQAPRLAALAADLAQLATLAPQPWEAVYRWAAAALTLEGQEYAVALLLEPHGALIDDLGDTLDADDPTGDAIDGRMACGALRALIARDYAWALAAGAGPDAAGMPALAVACEVAHLFAAMPEAGSIAGFLMQQPHWRHVVRRVQRTARHPYAEIRDPLHAATLRPADLLRGQLALCGAARFAPQADGSLRVTLFEGAPVPERLNGAAEDLRVRAA